MVYQPYSENTNTLLLGRCVTVLNCRTILIDPTWSKTVLLVVHGMHEKFRIMSIAKIVLNVIDAQHIINCYFLTLVRSVRIILVYGVSFFYGLI